MKITTRLTIVFALLTLFTPLAQPSITLVIPGNYKEISAPELQRQTTTMLIEVQEDALGSAIISNIAESRNIAESLVVAYRIFTLDGDDYPTIEFIESSKKISEQGIKHDKQTVYAFIIEPNGENGSINASQLSHLTGNEKWIADSILAEANVRYKYFLKLSKAEKEEKTSHREVLRARRTLPPSNG